MAAAPRATLAEPSLTRTIPPAASKSKPVIAWAAFGALCIGVIAQGWIRWIASGDLEPTPHGIDDFDGPKLALLRVAEVVWVLVALYVLWRFLVRPWIREREVTFDGMMVIACSLAWFYDPLDNYFNFSLAYNTHFVNVGSWAAYIPGFNSPRQELLPEPVLFAGGSYVFFLFGMSLVGCAVLRWFKARYPTMSTLGLFTCLALTVLAVDAAIEWSWIRAELMTYPGAPGTGTIFAGKPYQFPLWETLFIASWTVGVTMIRYLRDDKGRSFAERGIDEIGLTKRKRKFVQFLAITGFIHFYSLVGYFLPFQVMALKADTFPPMPSYLRAGICGEGTDYACPGKEFVPVPSRTSIPLAPDDPRLPEWVRDRQGR